MAEEVRTPLTLHPQLDYAETSANQPANPSRIVRWRVPDRIYFEFLSGTPIVAKLYRADGQQIDKRSRLSFVGRKPGAVVPKEITTLSYDAFYALTLDQLLDERYQGRTRVTIPFGGIVINEGEWLEVWLDSPDVVDWTNPNTHLSFDVIEVRPVG